MKTLKEQIKELKEQNPDWGYKKIAKELNCAPNTVKFHLDPACKIKCNLRVKKSRKSNPLRKKLQDFGVDFKWHMRIKQQNRLSENKVTLEELTLSLSDDLRCYLTGRPIDLMDSRSYHFDHKIPRSKGGLNTLDNLGIACREANQAKYDMTPEQFFLFCKEVLEFNGYLVTKTGKSGQNCTDDGDAISRS